MVKAKLSCRVIAWAAACWGLTGGVGCEGASFDPVAAAMHSGGVYADSTVATLRPSFRVREWTLDDGLSTPVLSVAQTPDGLLWITTFDGLFRFDGDRFQSYTTDNTPAFRSHDFIGVYASAAGDVWTGGRDGWVYRLRDGEWAAYDVTEILGSHWVQGFAEDAAGALWLVSTGDVVARFEGGRWVRFEQRIRNVWTPFVADPRGTLWTYLHPADAPGRPQVGFDRGGVVAQWSDGRFVPADSAFAGGFVSSTHGPLFPRPRGTDADLAREGSVRIDVTDGQGTVLGWYPVSEQFAMPRLVDRTGRVWVQNVGEDDQGTVMVYDDGREVFRFQPEGATSVEHVFEDRQGTVWIHTQGTGLFQISESPFRQIGPAEGAPRYAVRAALGPGGAILVSPESDVDETGIAVVQGDRVEAVSLRLAPGTEVPRLNVRDGRAQVGQVVAAHGNRWGVTNQFLVRITGDVADVAWEAGPDPFWSLDPDSRVPGILWVGDREGRVLRFDIGRSAVTDTLRVKGRVFFARRTEDGRLWIGSEGGLAVLAGDSLRVLEEPALVDREVRMMHEGPLGTLWLATARGGLVRLRAGEARVFGVREGLPSDHVTAVTADPLGALWLGGRNVLHRVVLADVEAVLDGERSRADVVTLFPSHGHLGTNRKVSEVAWAPDGSLWVPSFSGVTRVDPALYARLFAHPPPARVDVLRTEAGETFAPQEGLRLPTGARTLDIEYTAAEFVAPSLVRFRTYLEGHDDRWVDRGAARRVTVGGLGPGAYTFWVQAMNGGGVWGDPVASGSFIVPRHPWETVWFALLCVGALVGLVVGVVRARVRVLTERQRELNRIVDERTEQLRAEKETVAAQAQALRSLDEAKSRVFANISHEFRTPLTLILGPLDDLLDGLQGPLSHDAKRSIAAAVGNGRRLLRLVNQLLDVSRLEAGRLVLEARPLDAAAFVERLAQAFAPFAERKHITFRVERPDHPVHATLDPDQFEKVLANLLGNAFKFTPEGGMVTVSLGTEAEADGPGALVVTVQDDGPGIAPEHLAHLFERFYQVDASSTRRQPGTGIGLALVKNLVELHGGTIDAESTLGEGATFTVRVPLGRAHLRDEDVLDAEDGAWQSPPEPTAVLVDEIRPALSPLNHEPDGDATTVLVVDDNPDIRAYVRAHLAPRYRVLEAADGRQALALTRARTPDLVVSDVMMPELDGFGLCQAIKEDRETAFIPVILLTARASLDSKLEGLGYGADDYLTKPFDVRELEARIDNLIASRQRLKARFGATAEGLGANGEAGAPPDAGGDSVDPVVAQVRRVIEARLSDDTFSVDTLADAVGMSRRTLYRQLRPVLDCTPMELIWQMRLDQAAHLLREQRHTVSEVAYGVGFKSVAHFCTRFREAYGATPAAYAAGDTAPA